MSVSLAAMNAASTIEAAIDADLIIEISIHPYTKDRWQAAARALRIVCQQGICIEERHSIGIHDAIPTEFVTIFKPVSDAGVFYSSQQITLFDPHKP